ncbi:MAG: Rid family hydrolase [Anaerolineae bacterium]|nr:Rid family hydrolase [Anaerolineae bacterium]
MAGYARAVRIGRHIWISGTTATDERSQPVAVGDAYEQACYILQKIERVLQQSGATRRDIVRTRIYLVNQADWQAVARAHAEFFSDVRPANTLVVVAALIGADYLVESKAEAYLSD